MRQAQPFTKTLTASAAWLAALLCLLVPAFFISRISNLKTETSSPGSALLTIETYRRSPLRFEANQGQFDPQVKFASRLSGYDLFLTSTEAVLALPAAAVRMKLTGANPRPLVAGLDELSGKSNYFTGDDPKKWRTGVPGFARVCYEDVYPGISLIYYGNQQYLEYDFIVAPGADPAVISLAFEGANGLRLDPCGDLVIETASGEVRHREPAVYQEAQGVRQAVEGRYALGEGGEVAFEVGEYDKAKPLVIDPILSYSTYLGGSGADEATDIAVDATGSVYLVGHTTSSNFPVASAFQPDFHGSISIPDVFVTKLSQAGDSIVYSTYLGGSGNDLGLGIALDATGNAYVTGFTGSPDFPTRPGSFSTAHKGNNDAFVTKLNAQGAALVYSTFLGGVQGQERGNAIAVDAAGNAYVAGKTTSSDFPLTTGAFQTTKRGFEDAFVTKLNAQGAALVYSTFLGGNSDLDEAIDVAVDSSGHAYVTGATASANFPVTNQALQRNFGGGTVFFGDAFVTKLNAEGSALDYSTYLGGSEGDEGKGIAVDATGSAYVTGLSQSTNFPTSNAIQRTKAGVGVCEDIFSNCSDAFVTRLSASGRELIYSTYLGGGSQIPLRATGDSASDIAIDAAGNAYVTGTTSSTDFPTANALQPANAGFGDAFVAKVNATGSDFGYSTYFGGGGDEGAVAIAVDQAGNVYVAGVATSAGLPTTVGAFQTAFAGSFENFSFARDAFVAKFVNERPVILSVTIEGKKLIVTGKNFEMGAELLLNGSKQKKTQNDEDSPATRLVAKKSGKKISRGVPVTLQVKNPDGSVSDLFPFTRPD